MRSEISISYDNSCVWIFETEQMPKPYLHISSLFSPRRFIIVAVSASSHSDKSAQNYILFRRTVHADFPACAIYHLSNSAFQKKNYYRRSRRKCGTHTSEKFSKSKHHDVDISKREHRDEKKNDPVFSYSRAYSTAPLEDQPDYQRTKEEPTIDRLQHRTSNHFNKLVRPLSAYGKRRA